MAFSNYLIAVTASRQHAINIHRIILFNIIVKNCQLPNTLWTGKGKAISVPGHEGP
jgi:hypothetical protein